MNKSLPIRRAPKTPDTPNNPVHVLEPIPLQPETWNVHFYCSVPQMLDQKKQIEASGSQLAKRYQINGRIPNTSPDSIVNVDAADPEDRARAMQWIMNKALEMAEFYGAPYTWDIKVKGNNFHD